MWARLATREDARFGHAHKLLGLAVLGHYAWRVARWARTGTTGLDEDPWTPLWLLVHALLHATSFQFHVAGRRNHAYNVIWPEMRLHTTVFAARSLVVAAAVWLSRHALSLAVRYGRLWPAGAARLVLAFDPYDHATTLPWLRVAAVFGAMLLADVATAATGGAVGTMRGNPYPRGSPPIARRLLNLFYSVSQGGATVAVLSATSVEPVFMVLLPIQVAPLLMTLVKKGFLRQAGWHLWYTASLLAVWAHAIRSPRRQLELAWPGVAALIAMFALLRLCLGMNKYAVWAVAAWFVFAAPAAR